MGAGLEFIVLPAILFITVAVLMSILDFSALTVFATAAVVAIVIGVGIGFLKFLKREEPPWDHD